MNTQNLHGIAMHGRNLLPGAANRSRARAAVGHGILAVRTRLVCHSTTALDLDEFVFEACTSGQVEGCCPKWVGAGVLARRQRGRICRVPVAELVDGSSNLDCLAKGCRGLGVECYRYG